MTELPTWNEKRWLRRECKKKAHALYLQLHYKVKKKRTWIPIFFIKCIEVHYMGIPWFLGYCQTCFEAISWFSSQCWWDVWPHPVPFFWILHAESHTEIIHIQSIKSKFHYQCIVCLQLEALFYSIKSVSEIRILIVYTLKRPDAKNVVVILL